MNRQDIAERIAQSLKHLDRYDKVIEVGPGKGMLTQYLLDQPFELHAVEADYDMVDYLYEYLPSISERLIREDFLKLNLNSVFEKEQFAIIGNFPYNISSQILFKMIEYRDQIPEDRIPIG